VATLIRRGKIREVKFPYVRITFSQRLSFFFDFYFLLVTLQNLGARRNVESILGTNPLLWWCPNVGPLGTGLKYQLGEWDGKWVEVSAREPPRLHERSYAYV
jgi:palmitoyltransferase